MTWERDNYKDWELHPDVRTSTHVFTKWAPVNVILDTPGTAQDLFVVDRTTPTVNMVPNPSFENGINDIMDGTPQTNATIAEDTANARSGSRSLSVQLRENDHVGSGVYLMTDQLGAGGSADLSTAWYMTASTYFNNLGDTSEHRLEIRSEDGETILASSAGATTDDAWERVSATIRLTTKGENYRVYFVLVSTTNAATHDVAVDDVQIEIHRGDSGLTNYCDGDQGNHYEWFGTPHNSVSRRRIGLVSIRGFQLHASYGCYIALDQIASPDLGTYIPANGDWNMVEHPIDVRRKISFINTIDGEQPRITGAIWGTHVLLSS